MRQGQGQKKTGGGPSFKTKDICRFYFGAKPSIESANIWTCRCKSTRKQDPKNGHGNLMNHIRLRHPTYLEDYKAAITVGKMYTSGISTAVGSSSSSSTDPIHHQMQIALDVLIDKKSSNVFTWLEWIVMEELPLQFCEDPLTRKNTTLSMISAKTLKKYLFLVVTGVEQKIQTLAKAKKKYALVFDDWSEDGVHFLGKLIIIYTLDNPIHSIMYLNLVF